MAYIAKSRGTYLDVLLRTRNTVFGGPCWRPPPQLWKYCFFQDARNVSLMSWDIQMLFYDCCFCFLEATLRCESCSPAVAQKPFDKRGTLFL